MNNVNDIVDAMLQSPLGCAFRRQATASKLSPAEIAIPRNSRYLSAYASGDVGVWNPYYQQIRKKILQIGPQYRDLATAILEQPASAEWFKPLDPKKQVYLPRNNQEPTPTNFKTPRSELTDWERYAEKFEGLMFTHAYVDGDSSIYVAIDEKVGDPITGQKAPYQSWLLKAEKNIRILEIENADGWHMLCARYPTAGSATHDSPDFSMDSGRIVPDWYAVAQDWDAVHISFGAMLMTDQVRVESKAGWTFNWAWQIEQTLWLRWAFTSIDPLPSRMPQRRPEHLSFPGPIERTQ
jgi:hypothetical protein